MSKSLSQDNDTDKSQVLLSRVARIQHKVDSLEQTTAFALRADSARHLAEVKKIFGRSSERARVYLAANGSRNVQEVAAYLGMKRQNVGVEVQKLIDEGLLEVVDTKGNSTVCAKTALHRTLRIPAFLCGEFDLERDGRRLRSKKRTIRPKRPARR
ncbi:MAG: MarR family transcriptional regulator [Terriglobia bacterium]